MPAFATKEAVPPLSVKPAGAVVEVDPYTYLWYQVTKPSLLMSTQETRIDGLVQEMVASEPE